MDLSHLYLQNTEESEIVSLKKKMEAANNQIAISSELKKRILQNYVYSIKLQIAQKKLQQLKSQIGHENDIGLKESIQRCETEIHTISKKIKESQVDIYDGLTEQQNNAYTELLSSFDVLRTSSASWKLKKDSNNNAHFSNRESIHLKNACFLPLGNTRNVPFLGNFFIYPQYIIQAISNDDLNFIVYPIGDITVSFDTIKIKESFYRPKDAEVVCYSYKYTNLDGRPDLRYNNNPRTPIYSYGELRFVESGISIIVSNEKFTKSFAEMFAKYRFILTGKETHPVVSTIDNESLKALLTDSDKRFVDTQAITKKLLAFYEKIANDPGFRCEFEKIVPVTILSEAFQTNDLKDLMLILYRNDIIRTYLGLGYGMNLKIKEGEPIILFICLSMLDVNVTIDIKNYKVFIEKLRPRIESVLKDAQNFMKDNDFFVFTEILKDYDKELLEEYVILLYRFASLVAKVDGTVTGKESSWLKSIIELKNQQASTRIEEANKTGDNTTDKKDNLPVKSESLDDLIGLKSVKKEIRTLTNFVKVQKMREEKGLKVTPISYHCVFTGNPGTGKTTVARIVSQIYKDLGVLQKGHLIETDRSGLVAEYVGQTAVKTNKIIDSALDGILFIDEAYSLVDGGNSDYGKEAISTLLKRMEDDRERLVVILAGYTDDMQRFIDSNPGLLSRFNRYIQFEDYSADELYQIFEINAKKYDYTLTEEASVFLKEVFERAITHRDKSFGNGRYVRNVFEKVVENQANRLSLAPNVTSESLATIEVEDIKAAI